MIQECLSGGAVDDSLVITRDEGSSRVIVLLAASTSLGIGDK